MNLKKPEPKKEDKKAQEVDNEEDYEELEEKSKSSDMGDDENISEEQMQKMKLRVKQMQASAEDIMWPDEVETPLKQLAQKRFARYRGLKSFRSSPWGTIDNPPEYNHIFQFENYKKTQFRVVANHFGVEPSLYISIKIKNVPKQLIDEYNAIQHGPLLLIGIFKYENKVSVLHFTITRTPNYTEPIKSKSELIFRIGFRQYKCNPIFSENSINSDKHKYERFLQMGRTSIASVYQKIQYSPAPLLVFKEIEENGIKREILIATGSLQSIDPDRMIVKKIVLTGYPFKTHKNSAVIRYMFFNPDDVNYFAPIQLWTKHGLNGHIKEPLGTHGHMKCIFDNKLKSMDTVCMSLYKRQFCVWPFYDKTPQYQAEQEMVAE